MKFLAKQKAKYRVFRGKIHEENKAYKYSLCDYVWSVKDSLKNILTQFMKKRSHTSSFVIPDALKKVMRKRNPSVHFVIADFLKKVFEKND